MRHLLLAAIAVAAPVHAQDRNDTARIMDEGLAHSQS